MSRVGWLGGVCPCRMLWKWSMRKWYFGQENCSVPGVQQVTRGWFNWILNCPWLVLCHFNGHMYTLLRDCKTMQQNIWDLYMSAFVYFWRCTTRVFEEEPAFRGECFAEDLRLLDKKLSKLIHALHVRRPSHPGFRGQWFRHGFDPLYILSN